jgi:hypothetical protein
MSITFDASDLSHLADDLEKVADELPAAISRAVNRAGDMACTAAGRVLAEETGLLVHDVRSDFEVERATPEDPVYTITIKSWQTTLGQYQPRPTRYGISVRPWAQRRIFPSSFDVRGEVYHRVGRERYPIVPLYGPNVAVEAYRGATTPVIEETAARVLPQRLEHEITRLWPRARVPFDADLDDLDLEDFASD